MENLLALFEGFGGIPLIGDEGQSEILGEASSDVVLGDVVAIEVDAGEVRLSIFEPSNDEVVIVGVLVVALLVAEAGEVVGVVGDRVADVVVEEEALVGEFSQSTGRLLEISVLSCGSDEHVVGDLLVSVDSGVFLG
jgi:hypothetical protein